MEEVINALVSIKKGLQTLDIQPTQNNIDTLLRSYNTIDSIVNALRTALSESGEKDG